MIKQWAVIAVFILSFPLIAPAENKPGDWADHLMEAYENKASIPVLSDQQPQLDLKTAYLIQKAYVELRLNKDQVAGFKAGLTSPRAQKMFGEKAPLFGVLFRSGQQKLKGTIFVSDFKKLMIETEIAFVLGKPITMPIQNTTELRQYIQSIVPAIELPDIGFSRLKGLKGVDLVAANIGSAQYILGTPVPVNKADPNQITVQLSLNEKRVNQGSGRDALGNQWDAVLWLVNMVLEQGWQLRPGQILFTGALGNMIPGKPGNYIADFGHLGQVSFVIQ